MSYAAPLRPGVGRTAASDRPTSVPWSTSKPAPGRPFDVIILDGNPRGILRVLEVLCAKIRVRRCSR